MTALVGGLFLFLFAASVWYQFVSDDIEQAKVPGLFYSPLALGLLPRWTFFAPRPGMHDYHVFYRDELEPGLHTPWCDLELTPKRRWADAVFNPGKRRRKFVADMTLNLLKLDVGFDHPEAKQLTMLSLPYLVFVTEASRYDRPSVGQRTQFLLATSGGEERELRPVYESALHDLVPASP